VFLARHPAGAQPHQHDAPPPSEHDLVRHAAAAVRLPGRLGMLRAAELLAVLLHQRLEHLPPGGQKLRNCSKKAVLASARTRSTQRHLHHGMRR